MGGNSSTQNEPRRITVQHGKSEDMITITEDARARMKGEEAEEKLIRQQEAEAELRRIELHYKNKLLALEKKKSEMYQTTTDAFEEAVTEVENKFHAKTGSPICADLQQEVLQCYRDNPKKTLNCSELVSKFNNCVMNERETFLANMNNTGA